MNLGAIAGWASVVPGQLVSWPRVLKLRRERGDGVSLASYAIVTVSMTLFFLHAVAIGDVVSVASVPVSMVPNILSRRRYAVGDAFVIRLPTLGDPDGHVPLRDRDR